MCIKTFQKIIFTIVVSVSLLAGSVCFAAFKRANVSFASAASSDFNLSSEFWKPSDGTEPDNYLSAVSTKIIADEQLSGDYSVSFEMQDLSPWILQSNGNWKNRSDGGAFFLVLGAKKRNNSFPAVNDFNNGVGGLCMRIADSYITSPVYIGGPYPYYDATGASLGDGFSNWLPSGQFLRNVNLPVRYKFEVLISENIVKIYGDVMTGTDVPYTYRGHIGIGESERLEGYVMLDIDNETFIDNICIENAEGIIYQENFNAGALPEKILMQTQGGGAQIKNRATILSDSSNIKSEFFLTAQEELLLDASFALKSSGSVQLAFGQTDKQNFTTEKAESLLRLVFENNNCVLMDGNTEVARAQGVALASKQFMRICLDRSGTIQLYTLQQSTNCPVEAYPQKLVISEKVQADKLIGYFAFFGNGKTTLSDFNIADGSFDAVSKVKSVVIEEDTFRYIRDISRVVPLSCGIELSPPLSNNAKIFWTVISGNAYISDVVGNRQADGNFLKINNYGKIVLKATSVYDPSVSDIVEIYTVKITGIRIEAKNSGENTYELQAVMDAKPFDNPYKQVKWQVVEGNAEIKEGNILTVHTNEKVVVKAISVFDESVNAEYTVGLEDSSSGCGSAGMAGGIGASAVTVALLLLFVCIRRRRIA